MIVAHHFDGAIAFYRGDGSERCLICGWRSYPSWYVGRRDAVTDEGLPERYPVCTVEHGALLMAREERSS